MKSYIASTYEYYKFGGFKYQIEQEILPHVYTSSSISQNNLLSDMGKKYLLPVDTERHNYEACTLLHYTTSFFSLTEGCHGQDYEEVILPPARPVPPRATERLIAVTELDDICKGSFPVRMIVSRLCYDLLR